MAAEIQPEILLYSTTLLHKKGFSCWQQSKISAASSDNILVLLPNTLSLYSMDSQQCIWSISSSPNDSPFVAAREVDSKVFAYSEKKITCWDTRDNSSLSMELSQDNLIAMECSQAGIILAFANGEILLISRQDLREVKKLNLLTGLIQASLIDRDEEILLVVTSSTIKRYQISTSGFKLNSESAITADLTSARIVKVDEITKEPLIISSSRKLIICREQPLEICLEKYFDFSEQKVGNSLTKYVPGVDVCQLPSGMLAVVSQKGAIDYLTIWDSQFGTLQLEEKLNLMPSAEDSADFSSKSFSICHTESESHGSVIGIGLFTKPPHSKTISLNFSLVPYYSPKMSLLTAMGRLTSKEPTFDPESFTGQLSSIIPIAPPTDATKTNPLKIWKTRIVEVHQLDELFLEKVLDPKLGWNVGTFQERFQEWISEKHASLRKWRNSKSARGSKKKHASLLDFPKTEFSNRAMSILIGKCFESPETFWPRNVIEYLLLCGGVSRSMVSNGLINTLIAKNEIDLLELCFNSVIDMNECDCVTVLKFVSTTSETSPVPDLFKHWWDEKLKKKAETEADINSHGVARKLDTIMKKDLPKLSKSKFGVCLNEGQKKFMHYCFSAPRVPSIFIKELGSLTVAELHTILEWLREIISAEYDTSLENTNINQKFPLWWLWYDLPTEKKYQNYLDMEYQKWLTAIDAFGLVIDSHLSTIRLSAELQLVCAELGSAIKRDSQLLSLYERKLKGPLLASVCETTVSNYSKSRSDCRVLQGYGKNWNNLVKQMEIGVGEYAVEEFEI